MKKFLLALALIASVVVGYFSVAISNLRPTAVAVLDYTIPQLPTLPEIQLSYEHSAAIIDGEIIASQPNEQQFPTASTAKMILALAIREKYTFALDDRSDTITLTESDYNKYITEINTGGSHTKVQAGQKITVYDALASVLVRSSNNMADSLAEHVFGSHEAYKAHATELLQRLGATHTTIGNDASGRHYSTTSTTSDLALIGYQLLQDEVLAQIVNTQSIDIPIAGTITNTNYLLGQDDIIGVKTGHTHEAGYCLVLGANHGTHQIVTVILGSSDRNQLFADSHNLIKSIKNTLPATTIITQDAQVGYYDPWWTDKIPIYATENLATIAWQDDGATAALDAPDATPGTDNLQGVIELTINNQNYIIPVASTTKIPEPSLWQKILRVAGFK